MLERRLIHLIFNSEHRVVDAAFPASGAAPGLGEAAPIRECETACQAGARGERQFSSLTGHGFLDVFQVSVDIFFRHPNRLGDIQCRHGLPTQQVDDLLAMGSHGCVQDAFLSTCARMWSMSPGRQAAISPAQVS
jgi:hypothetical protein